MAWLHLRAGDLSDLKQLMQRKMAFLSHVIQNELLQLMSNNVLRQILGRTQNSPYFGVVVNETTVMSTQEQFSLCLRYLVDDVTPTETFIGLYQVTSMIGLNLYTVLSDVLRRCNLSMTRFCAQCYDGASNCQVHFLVYRVVLIKYSHSQYTCTATRIH